MGANICLPAPLRPGQDRGAQLHLQGTSISEPCCQAVAGTLPPASGCRCGFMGCRRTRQGHRSQSSRGCCSRGRGEAALPRALCVLQGGRGAELGWVGEPSPPAQPIPSGLLHRDRDLCARRGCLPFILTYVVLAWLCALCVQFFLLPGRGGTRRIAFLPSTWCVVYPCLRLGVQRAPWCSSVPTAGDAQGAGKVALLVCCCCCCSRGGKAGAGAGSLVSFTFGLHSLAAPVPGGALAEDGGARGGIGLGVGEHHGVPGSRVLQGQPRGLRSSSSGTLPAGRVLPPRQCARHLPHTAPTHQDLVLFLVPPPGSALVPVLGLGCQSDLVRAAEGKHLENHPGFIGTSKSLPATLQAQPKEVDLGVLWHLWCLQLGALAAFNTGEGEGAGCPCPLPFVFTLCFVSSRYGREEMQRVDVFASCVYPVYIGRIMDSVSYLPGYLR